MNKIFEQRLVKENKQNSFYLSRVFNEQFIGFLFIVITFAGYQYLHYLSSIADFPDIWFLMIIYSFIMTLFGDFASHLKTADEIFLNPDLVPLKKFLNFQLRKSFLFNGLIQAAANLVLLPIFLILTNFFVWVFYCLVFIFIKFLIIYRKYKKITGDDFIDWQYAIFVEEKRVNRLNYFFSFFTDLIGTKTEARPSKNWEFIVHFFQTYNQSFYWILFVRYAFRGRQLMSSLILTNLVCYSVVFFSGNLLLAGIFSIIGLLAAAFQISPIFKHFDRQIMVRVYPSDSVKKMADFKLLSIKLFSTITFIYLVLILVRYQTTAVAYWFLIIFLVDYLVIAKYLPYLVGSKHEIKK
ncbi:ABC transporter permease [Oenococcus alcoholitolerans]|uniref:ABC transporter permease n=1 Tax=Oenococcus alcoholitolerans TaxID=931074 RepID=UPI003F718EA3